MRLLEPLGLGPQMHRAFPSTHSVRCSLSRDFYFFAFISENVAAITPKCTPSEPETLTSGSWRQYSNSQGKPLLGSVGVRSSFYNH